MSSLQVINTGWSVFFNRARTSPLPPLSPEIFLVGSLADIDSRILLSDCTPNPPLKWSTSSSRIRVLSPLRSPPKDEREVFCDPMVAALLIAAAFLSSDAFISITDQPRSMAAALAMVVLPVPGGPTRSMPLFWGIFPSAHLFSHARIFPIASEFPTRSSVDFGRWRSLQSPMPSMTPRRSRRIMKTTDQGASISCLEPTI